MDFTIISYGKMSVIIFNVRCTFSALHLKLILCVLGNNYFEADVIGTLCILLLIFDTLMGSLKTCDISEEKSSSRDYGCFICNHSSRLTRLSPTSLLTPAVTCSRHSHFLV